MRLVRSAAQRLRRQLQRGRAPREPEGPPTILEPVPAPPRPGSAAERVDAWFERQAIRPFAFQREVWARYRAGESGLLHASTGTGKTLAAWLGPVMEAIDRGAQVGRPALEVIWITPMRALAADTLRALAAPLSELGLPWRIGLRTGDTSSTDRARQDRKGLNAMVTTPESLSLLLTRPDQARTFGAVKLVVVDEWHELIGGKRGVQVELALARLRRIARALRVWGLSATLGNLEQAREVLLPGVSASIVAGSEPKSIVIDSLIPEDIRRFPWAGHLGLRSIAEVAVEIEKSRTTLVFTNVRSQAEFWYRALLDHRPDWAGIIGLHHGSLDIGVRRWVEDGLRAGTLKAAVCTSSLDLGVDFSPVDRVIQIGSPKSVARLLQRAGRSGHRPGAASRITCVPTHAMELVEAAAARGAASTNEIEARTPLRAPLDVLIQHVVTLAVGDGFSDDALFEEVRSTHAYRALSRSDWEWVLDFAGGGGVLSAYPEYHRIARDEHGVYRITGQKLARRHCVQIGTIVSDASVNVQFMRGAKVGSVEESFLAKLRPGDRFTIGGRAVEFVRMRDMTAWVRRAGAGAAIVPRWMGGRLSLSSALSSHIRRELETAEQAHSPEMAAVLPLIELQRRHSHVPAADELLVEQHLAREGMHLCVFAFAGRHVHSGLATLLAWRLGQRTPLSFSMAFNDYGFELLSPTRYELDVEVLQQILSPARAEEDILTSINAAELARRHFREIARVTGLVFQGYPGNSRSAKQLQVTSGLLYDVYARHDPGNPLLEQARREVLERELELSRLTSTLDDLARRRIVFTQPTRLTPLALPLIAEQMRNTLSTEQLATRVQRMQAAMQKDVPSGRLPAGGKRTGGTEDSPRNPLPSVRKPRGTR
jgi:ATP-dependent Lhr-like helicase